MGVSLRDLPPIADAYDLAACGLMTTLGNGTIVRVNATFCRWVGYQASELVELRRLQDFLTIGGKVFQQTHWAPLLQMQRSVAEVKLDIKQRDETLIPMLINASRRVYRDEIFDDFSFVVVKDRHAYERELLLARKNAEDALEAKRDAQHALLLADRRKDEFLATLAHELRNPLGPMRMVLDLLGLKEFSDSQVRWSHEVLNRQLGHLSHLVDDLLEVSRINEGKIELRKTRVDLSTLMRTAVETSQTIVNAASHELTVEYPSTPVFLDADPTRLSQVFSNLLINAAKYTPRGGTLRFTGTQDQGDAVITVQDSGIGISADDLPKLFQTFSQLIEGRDLSQGGLGIGLSLVRTLVDLHGGIVTAASAGVGMGSEFTVKLPALLDLGISGTSELAPPPAKTRPQRVLVVDDNEDAAASLAMLLEMEGHTMQVAENGLRAIQLLGEFHPDTVVLDIGLPGMDGYEVARNIRETPSGQKLLLIALTGWGQEQDKSDAKASGFDFHFTKPVDVQRLLDALNGSESVPRL
ncbi:hybrid sensor histidine kinase/response regulator [Caballeronia sordidicola]|uniref:hybrid sensor histidine kinase/response regulator n=1 Tax=Caballeronia sordidicola TaxID=196367 RepID=UPI00094C9AF8|nr:ATP-binding protein [Caballeronia sordidicola]